MGEMACILATPDPPPSVEQTPVSLELLSSHRPRELGALPPITLETNYLEIT